MDLSLLAAGIACLACIGGGVGTGKQNKLYIYNGNRSLWCYSNLWVSSSYYNIIC